ncbi:MAG: hypothetical protein GXO88_15525 [Chlorobi bacterium]|nr:hypothetical protein [Chlorobiota bacterium]
MSKKKKKKTKVVAMPQSEATKIRSRARNLKIDKCYITGDWEEAREGQLIVTRRHTNDNLTVGFFLIDFALLGVKDTFYKFNILESELDETMESIADMAEIDYNMAHNIVWGAVEYAEDFGFNPHKDFKISQYILEEDDDNIPLIDIEFGLDGKPTVFCDDANLRTKEITHLEKTIGRENFNVMDIGNVDDYDLDDEFEDMENHELDEDIQSYLMPGWNDDIEEMGVLEWDNNQMEEFLKKDLEDMSIRILQYFIDKVFLELHKEIPDIDAFEVVTGKSEYNSLLNNHNEIFDNNDFALAESYFKVLAPENSLEIVLNEIFTKHSDSFDFLFAGLNIAASHKDSEDILLTYCKKLISLFPLRIEAVYFMAVILYASNRMDEIKEFMDNKATIYEYCKKDEVSRHELELFSGIWLMYFLDKEDLIGAEHYYQVFDVVCEPDDVFAKILIQRNILMKMDDLQGFPIS